MADILEEIYNRYIYNPYLQMMKISDQYDATLEQYKSQRPTELKDFKGHLIKLNGLQQQVSVWNFGLSTDIISIQLNDFIESKLLEWGTKVDLEVTPYYEQIFKIKDDLIEGNKTSNKLLRQQNTIDNSVYRELEELRTALEKYSDKIMDVCSQYGVKTSDVIVTEDMFSVDELKELYKEYIKYIEKDVKQINPISYFRDKISDWRLQGGILLLTLVLLFTPILDFLSMGMFAYIGYTQLSLKKRVKYYTILMGITFNINPKVMGYKEFDESMLLPEEISDDDFDNLPEVIELDAKIELIEKKYEKEHPDNWSPTLINQLHERRADYDARIAEIKSMYERKMMAIEADIKAEIAYVQDAFEKTKKATKFLGSNFSTHLVMRENYILGIKEDILEEEYVVGNNNLIIRPCKDEQLLTKFLWVLYTNVITGVFPGRAVVYVYDPNNFGRTLMPFYQQDLNKHLIIESNDLSHLIDDLKEYAQENFKLMGGKEIAEFNQECEDLGKTPIDYKFLIILSQPKTVEEDEQLQAFFEYSATGGVYIWAVSEVMQSTKAKTFRVPFENVAHPYTNITDEWCKKVSNNYVDAIKNTKTASLMWNDFVAKAIPEEKVWTGCADQEIELYPGFLNGDPTSYKPYTVGNEGNVHIIGVGGTGAGKSVFLNHLIACVSLLYPPNEVELWLSDFKGTEFKFYLASETYPFMLPHIKACLCTSDPDYATSLFHALRVLADDRYEQMKIYNQKNMVGWNKYWKQKYAESGDENDKKMIWPRVLFICDEFQVIFEKADAKNLDSIKADITQLAKVARAAGVHIFFTSQSMKKTLSADILQQFTLRFALRCDAEVSTEILGTTKASDIKEKNGYLIVRSVEMSLEDQKRYRTPFLPDSDKPGKPSELRKHIKRMYDKAMDMNFELKDVITYEEATKHPIKELIETYQKPEIIEKLPNSGVFFLGNRMAYTQNKAPDNIVLTRKNNANIFSVFSDYTDLVYFFNTIVTNISCNKIPGTVIINSQIQDLITITGAEEYVTLEQHKKLLSPKNSCKEITQWISTLVQKRSEDKKNIDKPVWIILMGWDKGSGFGIDMDYNLRDKLCSALQTAGEYNIHFIFICTGAKDMSDKAISACAYRIAGKCDEDSSRKVIDLPTGWMFSLDAGRLTKDKLYISEPKGEIEVTEIVI